VRTPEAEQIIAILVFERLTGDADTSQASPETTTGDCRTQ
jgi:hypothetical protein